MAVKILSLASGQLSTTSQTVIYTSPVGPPALTSIVKSIRLVNTDTVPRTINLYFTPNGGSTRRIAPPGLSIAAGSLVIDDQEITMASGDAIKADASAASVIDFVISGIQR